MICILSKFKRLLFVHFFHFMVIKKDSRETLGNILVKMRRVKSVEFLLVLHLHLKTEFIGISLFLKVCSSP